MRFVDRIRSWLGIRPAHRSRHRAGEARWPALTLVRVIREEDIRHRRVASGVIKSPDRNIIPAFDTPMQQIADWLQQPVQSAEMTAAAFDTPELPAYNQLAACRHTWRLAPSDPAAPWGWQDPGNTALLERPRESGL